METRWHTREEQSENSKRHSEKKWYSTTTYSPAKEVSPSTAQLQLLKTFYLKQGALVSMETALRDGKAQERPKKGPREGPEVRQCRKGLLQELPRAHAKQWFAKKEKRGACLPQRKSITEKHKAACIVKDASISTPPTHGHKPDGKVLQCNLLPESHQYG